MSKWLYKGKLGYDLLSPEIIKSISSEEKDAILREIVNIGNHVIDTAEIFSEHHEEAILWMFAVIQGGEPKIRGYKE